MKFSNILAVCCLLAALAMVLLHYAIHYRIGTAPAPTAIEGWIIAGLVAAALFFADNERAERILSRLIDHLPSFRKSGEGGGGV